MSWRIKGNRIITEKQAQKEDRDFWEVISFLFTVIGACALSYGPLVALIGDKTSMQQIILTACMFFILIFTICWWRQILLIGGLLYLIFLALIFLFK